MEITARVHSDDDGTFWAEVVELPGCFASGHSWDELMEALKESVFLYLADDDDAPNHPSDGPQDHPSLTVDEMKLCVPA